MAGNHDWINNHFIFEEVERTLEIIDIKKLHIMSVPKIYKIEGSKILFFPFYYRTNLTQEVIDNIGISVDKLQNEQIKSTLKKIYIESIELYNESSKYRILS